MQILAQFESLSFELEFAEPFFCTIALYDVTTQERISETFSFDLNSPEANAQCKVGALVECNSCIFQLLKPSSDIHMVLRIHKVLRGELEKDVLPYLKAKTVCSTDARL
jgi:hypothetical protein